MSLLAKTGLAVLLLAVAVPAVAQEPPGTPAPSPAREEGGRKGFVVGLGGGAGWLETHLPSFRLGSIRIGGGSETSVAVATNFKIGYAPSDHVLIYYANAAVFGESGSYDLLALTGGGVTYLHGRRAPTWFVHGAGGLASGGALDFTGSGSGSGSADLGSGFSVGGGVEFARRWFLDGTFLVLTIDSRRHTVLSGTINWIFY